MKKKRAKNFLPLSPYVFMFFIYILQIISFLLQYIHVQLVHGKPTQKGGRNNYLKPASIWIFEISNLYIKTSVLETYPGRFRIYVFYFPIHQNSSPMKGNLSVIFCNYIYLYLNVFVRRIPHIISGIEYNIFIIIVVVTSSTAGTYVVQ
jgi:hypothetical protein